MTTNAPAYSAPEELANVLTHALGALASAAALALLVGNALPTHDVAKLVTGAVFGVSLLLLYASSAAYHAVTEPRAKHLAKLLDHAGIYILIAGTYTPFTLITLRGPWGWGLFAAVWGLAVVGVVAESFWLYRPKWLSAVVYLAMGWMVVLASRQLLAALAPGGIALLVGGGLAYSVGTLFYVMKRVPFMHAVWHGFVLLGSACHVLAVVLYVIPSP